jgi:hypothetical protein
MPASDGERTRAPAPRHRDRPTGPTPPSGRAAGDGGSSGPEEQPSALQQLLQLLLARDQQLDGFQAQLQQVQEEFRGAAATAGNDAQSASARCPQPAAAGAGAAGPSQEQEGPAAAPRHPSSSSPRHQDAPTDNQQPEQQPGAVHHRSPAEPEGEGAQLAAIREAAARRVQQVEEVRLQARAEAAAEAAAAEEAAGRLQQEMAALQERLARQELEAAQREARRCARALAARRCSGSLRGGGGGGGAPEAPVAQLRCPCGAAVMPLWLPLPPVTLLQLGQPQSASGLAGPAACGRRQPGRLALSAERGWAPCRTHAGASCSCGSSSTWRRRRGGSWQRRA